MAVAVWREKRLRGQRFDRLQFPAFPVGGDQTGRNLHTGASDTPTSWRPGVKPKLPPTACVPKTAVVRTGTGGRGIVVICRLVLCLYKLYTQAKLEVMLNDSTRLSKPLFQLPVTNHPSPVTRHPPSFTLVLIRVRTFRLVLLSVDLPISGVWGGWGGACVRVYVCRGACV